MSISMPHLSKPGGILDAGNLRLDDTLKLTFAPKVLRGCGTNRHRRGGCLLGFYRLSGRSPSGIGSATGITEGPVFRRVNKPELTPTVHRSSTGKSVGTG
jgi:hypothetical protein